MVGPNSVEAKICEALGIKRCVHLTIDMKVGQAPLVKAEFYPDNEQLTAVETIVKDYYLVPNNAVEVTTFGDEYRQFAKGKEVRSLPTPEERTRPHG